jgi:hypothetical protein
LGGDLAFETMCIRSYRGGTGVSPVAHN